jgi:hypothetical protein
MLLRLMLLLLVFYMIFMAALMAFAPKRALAFITGNRVSRWYCFKVLRMQAETFTKPITLRWVRIQGFWTLPLSLLELYAWFMQTPAGG